MINFSIPGFCTKRQLNINLLSYIDMHREYFSDDVRIASCYDSYPCIWNGGRGVFGDYSDGDISIITMFYNSKKISLRYTFTNLLLEEKHLNDLDGNKILKVTSQNATIQNGVNTASLLLKNYIKEKYPEYYHLVSTTLCKKDINEINKLSKENIVVPDYSLNNNFDFLSKLENKDNIEILVGEACIDNCPRRSEHYTHISKVQLSKRFNEDYWDCPFLCERYNYYEILPTRNHYISIDDIRNKYVPLGFTNFKISGRSDNYINLIEKYVNYLVKPEFKDRVRNDLLIIAFNQ